MIDTLKVKTLFLQVVSWIITIWICGSLIIFMLARVLGGEVRPSYFNLPFYVKVIIIY